MRPQIAKYKVASLQMWLLTIALPLVGIAMALFATPASAGGDKGKAKTSLVRKAPALDLTPIVPQPALSHRVVIGVTVPTSQAEEVCESELMSVVVSTIPVSTFSSPGLLLESCFGVQWSPGISVETGGGATSTRVYKTVCRRHREENFPKL